MGSVPITAGTGTPIRTVSNAGVDSNANQQVVTLADSDGDFMHSKLMPSGTEDALMVRTMPAQVTRNGFNQVLASGPDPAYWSVIKAGSGQTTAQAGGALVLTTGTTANSETIIRGLTTYSGAVRARIRSYLSQRIANQSFVFEMVDVLGDGLAITINSATSVTVTFATNPFTAVNVGQSTYLGAYTGSGTFIPGRYPIASVSGNTVTYTVAGFAAGSGTCSVFGWNYHHLIYDGFSASTAKWDVQRKGWNNGDTSITTQTSASPGHLIAMYQNDLQASVMDSAHISVGTPVQFAPRAFKMENVPDDVSMVMQIRIVNGSTAPASSSTWTIGQTSISNWAPQDVAIQDVRPMSNVSALPVQVANNPAVSVSGIVSVSSGSISTSPNVAAVGALTAQTPSAAVYGAVVKTSAASLFEIAIFNASTATIYVKLYNKISAPVVSTDIPVLTIVVAPGQDREIEFGAYGKRFATGLAIGASNGAAPTDATALTAASQISLTYI